MEPKVGEAAAGSAGAEGDGGAAPAEAEAEEAEAVGGEEPYAETDEGDEVVPADEASVEGNEHQALQSEVGELSYLSPTPLT